MSDPTKPTRQVRKPLRRLDRGLGLLDTWSQTAQQCRRNVVYKALFAVLEGSVRNNHIVFDDPGGEPGAFTVMVREDLAVGIRVDGPDSFEITHVGPPGEHLPDGRR
jgi:hypothetical protein